MAGPFQAGFSTVADQCGQRDGQVGGETRIVAQGGRKHLGQRQKTRDRRRRLILPQGRKALRDWFDETHSMQFDGTSHHIGGHIIDFDDPDLRFVDLTGDGRADLLITSDAGLFIHPSRGGAGFDAVRRLPLAPDDRAGPRLLFSSPAEGEATLAGVIVPTADRTGLAKAVEPVRHGGRLQPSPVSA